MARARNIKPGLFKNEVLGEADPIYTVFFAGLWTVADREGRIEYRPKKIKAEILPYRFDLDPCLLLDWLKHESFITVYEIEGEKYLQINNWRKHQSPHHKEAESELPPPPKPTKEKKKAEQKQGGAQAQAKHESSLNQPSVKKNASCPTDSLNLIPDSLNPISTTTEGATQNFQTGSPHSIENWEPDQANIELLINKFRIPEKFIEEKKLEFKAYWITQEPRSGYDAKFINDIQRSWKRNGHEWTPDPTPNNSNGTIDIRAYGGFTVADDDEDVA